MATLTTLLGKPADRQRFLTLLDRVVNDPRIQPEQATPEQRATLARMREVLVDGAVSGGPARSRLATT
jgi:hypothetical protein